MDGPAYLDEALARDYVRVLAEEYDLPETLGKLWETVLLEHADTLHIYARKIDEGIIHEFDFLGDL